MFSYYKRTCFIMQNDNCHTKHHRGSSPPPSGKRAGIGQLGERVSVNRTGPEDSLTPLCGVEQRGNQRMELTAQESGPRRQSDDEGRWQDDGGDALC